MSSLYDRIGGNYRATRRADPRIAALIRDALGDAHSVVNVGAGSGAYEPLDREVLAVEPSETMIVQRPRDSAPAIQASAEELPLSDDSFDAALAVNTAQHWTDLRAGLRELRRVARQNISNFALAAEEDVEEGLARLEADLESGAWDRRYGHLRSLQELDLGHRLLITEFT